jgi:hypothetical protein
MNTARKVLLAALLLAGLAAPARADSLLGEHLRRHKNCPKPSYSPVHYWAPTLVRVRAHFHGPRVSPYVPDRHPGDPADMAIIKYPCPAVDPAALVGDRQLLP